MSEMYGYDFSWYNCKIRRSGFVTMQDRDRAFAWSLADLGYTEPRWFEFWRWGEHKPSDSVLSIFRVVQSPVDK